MNRATMEDAERILQDRRRIVGPLRAGEVFRREIDPRDESIFSLPFTLHNLELAASYGHALLFYALPISCVKIGAMYPDIFGRIADSEHLGALDDHSFAHDVPQEGWRLLLTRPIVKWPVKDPAVGAGIRVLHKCGFRAVSACHWMQAAVYADQVIDLKLHVRPFESDALACTSDVTYDFPSDLRVFTGMSNGLAVIGTKNVAAGIWVEVPPNYLLK